MTHVHGKQCLYLIGRKIQCCFVVRSSRIDNHSMQCPSLLDNLVHCPRDTGFLRHIGLDGEKLVGEAFG